MLNMICGAARGQVSHQALFDAFFNIERPDFLGMCPENYINQAFEKMAKIIDIKTFKKEAREGFSKMGLDADTHDHIMEAIGDANSANEVARVLYGVGVFLLTEYIDGKNELRDTLAARWMAEAKDMETTSDGFYTLEAENAMKAMCQDIFEGSGATDTVEPIPATDAPIVKTATTETQSQEQKDTVKKGSKNTSNK